MRIRLFVLIGALLLASAGLTWAEQDVPKGTVSPNVGRIDFGFRATDIDGDAARFQRFRDWRDGAFLSRFNFERERNDWAFSAEAYNVGYRDQRFVGDFQKFAKVKASFLWDQVPLYMSADSRSLFTHSGGGNLTIPSAVRTGIATGTSTLAAAQSGLTSFDLRNRRDTGAFNFVYSGSRELDLTFNLKSVRREGATLMNGTLGTPGGRTYELAVPLDHRSTDVTMQVEWANQKRRFSAGYTGSWFDNQIPTITWDNPFSVRDAASAPAQGRMAVFPNSTAHAVNTAGSVRLPGRSRANAFVSVGTWRQNETLLPPTSNTALAAPGLSRTTADAEARIVAMNYGFTSRPSKYIGVNARYRFYDYGNRTPEFSTTSMVVSDLSLGAAQHSSPASFNRQNFDVDVILEPVAFATLKVGYTRAANDYTGKVRTHEGEVEEQFRIFKNVDENVFRITGDSIGNRFVTLRGVYEFSQRRGKGFGEHGLELLDHVGEHPELRHFDVASRDRTRGTVILTVTPVPALGLNASFGSGHDDYTVDPDSLFGLRDNKHRVYNVGFDIVPGDRVDFGLNYGYERYTAFQYSRTANPLATDTGVVKQFLDPRRDWSIDSADKVRTVSASLGLEKLIPQTELRFGYDLSKAKATYVYGLAANTTLAGPAQLPPITNELQTGTADIRYFLRRDVAIGAVYWYDRYIVDDIGYKAIADGLAAGRLDQPTTGTAAMYLGYAYRPYTANSFALRLTYLW